MPNFYPGERVRYIPNHARGDSDHRDCEDGLVLRVGPHTGSVFVVYDNKVRGEITSIEQAKRWTAAGTNPSDLVKL